MFIGTSLTIIFSSAFSSHDLWVWSQWSPWSHCPNVKELCDQNLFTSRRRLCKNPAPVPDGEYCTGSPKQREPCPFIPCPKKGKIFPHICLPSVAKLTKLSCYTNISLFIDDENIHFLKNNDKDINLHGNHNGQFA